MILPTGLYPYISTKPSVLKNLWAYPLVEMQGCNLYRLFLHFKFSILGHFSQKRDRKHYGPTDKQADVRTDAPSYRDARMLLLYYPFILYYLDHNCT